MSIRAEAARREQILIDAVSKPCTIPEPIMNAADRLLLPERSRPDLNEARLRLKQLGGPGFKAGQILPGPNELRAVKERFKALGYKFGGAKRLPEL